MPQEFKLQDPGEGIHEAEILEVLVSEGDSVEEGEDMLSIETDKAAVSIPAPVDCTIEQIKVSQGQRVEVGAVLLTYTAAGEEDAGNESSGSEKKREVEEPEKPEESETKESAEAKSPESSKPDQNGSEREEEREEERKEERVKDGKTRKPLHEQVAAAPATRRLARELEVDLESVSGTGPGGRVEQDDVRRAAGEDIEESGDAGDSDTWGDIERVELGSIRRRIGEKMQRAWREIPHAMHSDTIDITQLERLRHEHKEDFTKQGGKLTLSVFLLKAIAIAVKDFPRFNASLDSASGELILKRYCHIGTAVDTDWGLLVPVLRNVADKSLSEIAIELARLAELARVGKLTPDDMRGGSITMTNPGSLGATLFTPIINFPEVAIVGLASARHQPRAWADIDGELNSGECTSVPLIVAFDHRVNDGADAARFAKRIGELLGSPEKMLLQA